MTIGEKIKTARLELLLTQKQMAEELGVSVMSIIRWENEQNRPTLSMQRKFREYCQKMNIVFDSSKDKNHD
jgi:transcriptional regulator with XRE-family HTH domain